ncbi:MAG: hypothetical protein PF693_01625 [Spirochaetia bacterium]|jgi:hypothetical protein|nr:hypothetical protein [Spirochaetia bacterium]
MKKIFFILIILAVLLFSGCDAMLEVFYPEYADDNVVNITISITTGDISNFSYDTNDPLLVELYAAGETPNLNSPFRSIEVYNKFDNYLCPLFVPEGSYDIWIWQDDNNDGNIDTGEFVLNSDIASPPNIIFTGTTGKETYPANNWNNFS